jgi:small subunit ribosomal protein S6
VSIGEKMTKYDLVSILRPTAEDSLVEEIHKNITEIITNNGGSISEQGVWQKRKLAYQIENFNEGIYSITTFDAPPTVPSELDRVLKISDDVIRHKVLKMES